MRVNPDFEVKGSGMRMGGGAQQFGVDVEEVPRLLKELEARDLDLRGFHVFSGSQNLHADILVEAQERTVDLVLRMAERHDCARRRTSTSAAGSASRTTTRTSRST